MERTRRTRRILLWLAASFLVFAGANSQSIQEQTSAARSPESVSNPLLIVRERLKTIGTLSCRVGLVGHVSHIQSSPFLTTVRSRRWIGPCPPCSDPALASEWKAPVSSKARRFALPQGALKQFESFLDRPEVKDLRDFMNAGLELGTMTLKFIVHRECREFQYCR